MRLEKQTDPVCGMSVDPARAAGFHDHDGHRYYFCGKGCLAKFVADPLRYVGPPERAMVSTPAPTAQPAGATYVCPMDPDVRQAHPGPCPKCGMALEPDLASAPATRVEYTCPMHPEIVRSEPGSCPICGMALEPRTVTLDDAPNPELVDMSRRFWIGRSSGCRSLCWR